MWRGFSNVGQYDSVLALSDFSFGKSSQSVYSIRITSHDQLCWFIINELECVITHLNGSQFRQVCSITHVTVNHSQAQHENTSRMHFHQRRVIQEKACLVVTPCKCEYSSTPAMEFHRIHFDPLEQTPMQASLVTHSHHNHSLSNTTDGQP